MTQEQRDEKLARAYHEMMERVGSDLEEKQSTGGLAGLQHYIELAKEKSVTLGELSREEAERVGDYLRRDVHDAAEYLSESGRELKDWMRFDLSLVEDRILDMFGMMVDQTREELDHLALEAKAMSEWQTGEVTGPGSLRCDKCGKVMAFRQPGKIPPCPQCHGTAFKRLLDEDEAAS